MKKQLALLTTGLLSGGLLLFTGCQKDDTTAPVITLVGQSTVTVSLNSPYVDAGAKAEDDEDGDITSSITVDNPVNKDKAGTYTVKYSVTDAAGNVGTASRTVVVKNDAEAWAGTYQVNDVCTGAVTFDYAQTITVSTTVNNRIHFNKFADYANNTAIYADIKGSSVDLPSQTATGIGSGTTTCAVANHTFAGVQGEKTSTGFSLKYTDQLVGPGSCTGAATTCVATFTKK